MKTEISTFCREFGEVLAPFKQDLQNTIEDIQGEPESPALKHPLSGLSDVHHRLRTLVDKVEQQQAYVIIFGPLKSGKSTLMNAISSAYVSEVTSLPAYPCLVYVKHNEEKRYQYTSYNGKKEVTTDGGYMQRVIRDAHQTLAERIRQVEEQGEPFDPGVHFPEAIRRVDVEVPAKNLKDSLTVLVDTPGLYSKMKFGYDLMTREFRNSAACAVFVVKTDNLFLEQVFAEFNDLLDLFSRIFLVVNIDGKKQDLGPDGVLRPSLESENPDRIIRAFESLAMSAPLRRAADEGRLRIYPIDLLRSAAASLRQENGSAGTENEAVDAENEGDAAVAGTDASQEAFSEFLTDLTDYLNSSDYLVEFMSDSLRQGATLAEDIRRSCSDESLHEFYREKSGLEEEIKHEKERLAAVEHLGKFVWEKAFDELRGQNRSQAESFAGELREELRSSLYEAVNRWFESEDSLRHLQEEALNPLLTAREERIKENAFERIRALTETDLGGMRLDSESLRSLDRLNFKLAPILKAGIDKVMEAARNPSSCAVHLSPEKVPVKKNFWDWILFRSQSAVRRGLFGPQEDPDRPVSPSAKSKRLGEPAKEALQSVLDTHLKKLFPDLPVEYSDQLLAEYSRAFASAVREEVDSMKTELDSKLPDLERRLESNKVVQKMLDRIGQKALEVERTIGDLKERHTNPANLHASGDEETAAEPEDESRDDEAHRD